MTKIFDGKKFAREKEELLSYKVTKLLKKGLRPKLVSLQIGDNESSEKYLQLKKAAAERVGISLAISNQPSDISLEPLIKEIEKLNLDKSVQGVMVQLPMPASFLFDDRQKVINAIDPKKDVDGMRDDSQYVTPVVLAVMAALNEVSSILRLPLKEKPYKVVVVGAEGFVGKRIRKQLKKEGYKNIEGVDVDTSDLAEKTLKADAIVSATGVAGLIKESMVKEGVVLVDVGAPVGDIDPSAALRASFITPVPGGIGPVTIYFLLENLAETARIQTD